MKKLFLAMLISIMLVATAYAQTWHTTNSVTVGWDAYLPPASGTISYRVFLANAITDPGHANPVTLGDTTEVTYVITLNTEGRYYPGVATVLTIGADELVSEINWSDDPEGNAGNEAWGIQYFLISPPGGFGPQ